LNHAQSREMTVLGIGPLLAIVGVAMAAIVVLGRIAGWSVALPSPWHEWAFWIGMIFMLVGVYFWISAALGVKRAFESHQLVRTGVFKLSRNPMYAGFIMFIIPGLAFVLNNVLLIAVSLAMYIAFKMFISREERYLASQFGEEFERYRKSVPQLIPFVRL
jgi:protein-S-isoprenylcysteine O-methyltransferase Ste14